MIHNLSESSSLVTQYVAELRDVNIQGDQARFRTNLERIGQVMAYEISKQLAFQALSVTTPLGQAPCAVLAEQPVLATILRAGLPLHQGLLHFFDGAESAFVSAYRKHASDGSFEIEIEYLSCPPLNDKILILADTMLATGASVTSALEALSNFGHPKSTHIVSVVASQPGLVEVERQFPAAHIWTAVIDPQLNEQSFIVPGLGDAGDLSYGEKVQR